MGTMREGGRGTGSAGSSPVPLPPSLFCHDFVGGGPAQSRLGSRNVVRIHIVDTYASGGLEP
jgi:hypothetical protein